jgi:hypothetical protein
MAANQRRRFQSSAYSGTKSLEPLIPKKLTVIFTVPSEIAVGTWTIHFPTGKNHGPLVTMGPDIFHSLCHWSLYRLLANVVKYAQNRLHRFLEDPVSMGMIAQNAVRRIAKAHELMKSQSEP